MMSNPAELARDDPADDAESWAETWRYEGEVWRAEMGLNETETEER